MANIFDVANYFLTKIDSESGEYMTHLKLQKLTYYAQAWHIALFDNERIFDAHFEAWAHGPVNPELYNQYRDYRGDPIPIPIYFSASKVLTVDEIEFLDDVWDNYGRYEAKHLERLTHQEKPWKEARGNIPYGQYCTTPINEETMGEFYRGLLEDEEENS
jgi:uncharacterized phage-associated protein